MFLASFPMFAWEGMDMPELHVEGRYLVDEAGNKVNLHGFDRRIAPGLTNRVQSGATIT